MGGKVLVPTQRLHPHAAAPRAWRPTCCDVPDRCSWRAPTPTAPSSRPATSTSATGRSSPGERTAEGFFRVQRRHRGGDRARPRATRPTPTSCGARPRRPTSPRRGSSPRASTRSFPGKLLAYNCSPSFNWTQAPRRRPRSPSFQTRARRRWATAFQFVTLAGFHALNLSMFELARGYRDARHVGLREAAGSRVRAHQAARATRAVKHQSFVGTGCFDEVAKHHRRRPDLRPPRLEGFDRRAPVLDPAPDFRPPRPPSARVAVALMRTSV